MNDKCLKIERSIITTYRYRIWSKFTAAIKEYELIQPGDKIAVCISGGKDSMLLAKCMQELKRHGLDNFELVFLVMDPGYNPINRQLIEDNARLMEIPVTVFESDIFDITAAVGGSPCYLCARMRRGMLYNKARELGCNKIALGHHFDDAVETIMMGMLYNGQIQTMMPKLKSDNFAGMELIRPLYHVREADIIAWKKYNGLEFLQCACKITESYREESGEGGSKRHATKRLLAELSKSIPNVEQSIFKSVYNVNIDNIIGYKKNRVRHHFLDDYYAGFTSLNPKAIFLPTGKNDKDN